MGQGERVIPKQSKGMSIVLMPFSDDALLSKSSTDTPIKTPMKTPIKTLQFNPRHPNLLATGGGKGEVRILFHNITISLTRLIRRSSFPISPTPIILPDWAMKPPGMMISSAWIGIKRCHTFWSPEAARDL